MCIYACMHLYACMCVIYTALTLHASITHLSTENCKKNEIE